MEPCQGRLFAIDQIIFLAASKFHLQGCMFYFKLIMKETAYLLVQFAGLANRHILCQVYMSFKMNLFIIQTPNVDMVNIFYFLYKQTI